MWLHSSGSIVVFPFQLPEVVDQRWVKEIVKFPVVPLMPRLRSHPPPIPSLSMIRQPPVVPPSHPGLGLTHASSVAPAVKILSRPAGELTLMTSSTPSKR